MGETRQSSVQPGAVTWVFEERFIDWDELSNLYRIAPLGEKKPQDLRTVFANSRFKCFLFDDGKLVGAGRALTDGRDCSYICDVAVHPDWQGAGLGRALIAKLRDLSAGHRKIILYAKVGAESFYARLGFKRMRTAMAIFEHQERAVTAGLLEP